METLTYLYGSGLQMPLLDLMFWIDLTMKNTYILYTFKIGCFLSYLIFLSSLTTSRSSGFGVAKASR